MSHRIKAGTELTPGLNGKLSSQVSDGFLTYSVSHPSGEVVSTQIGLSSAIAGDFQQSLAAVWCANYLRP